VHVLEYEEKNVQLQLLLVPRKLVATSMPNVPLPAFSFATSNKSGIVFSQSRSLTDHQQNNVNSFNTL
jgi:hypothetical protein